MIKKLIALTILIPTIVISQNQLTGISDSFDDGVLAETWKSNEKFELFENKNKLQINLKNAKEQDSFYWDLGNAGIDLSSNPKFVTKIKTGTPVTMFIELLDGQNNITKKYRITHSGDLKTKDDSLMFTPEKVNFKNITKLKFSFQSDDEETIGIVYLDDIKLGTGGPKNGDSNPFPLSYDIRLNQLGFYPDGPKIAIVKNPSNTKFDIAQLPDYKIVYTGTLSGVAEWEHSEEKVSVADFTEFTKEGNYVVLVADKGRSFNFSIKKQVHHEMAKSAIKFYYFQRSGMPLEEKYAGIYARPTGHPDDHVMVHSSATCSDRPTGTFINSSKGWYDAGDYGKYIVNSGISTNTILSLYEQFPQVYDTLNLNIPESGNKLPDLLDECLWNIRWMLTMQDPAEGAVYHKLTAHNFEGMTLPHEHTAQRLVVGKGTAAALDFAAVMAQSARIFKKFPKELPGFADTCIKAAEKAWAWAVKNPNTAFTNPSDVVTGEYGDGILTDEFQWAANELFITTKKDIYTTGYALANEYSLPGWSNVGTLGLYSLYNNRKDIASKYDTTVIKAKILKLAEPIVKESNVRSAYRVPMGTYGDFYWGSNSACANECIALLNAYKITKNKDYLKAAISGLDYLLGRNATMYSFVTGYGTKPAMFPHHRPSAGDKNVDPVPGMLVGGPQNTNNPEAGCAYPAELPATKYKDNVCSYSTNEVAINWNAPLVFAAGAIEAYMKK